MKIDFKVLLDKVMDYSPELHLSKNTSQKFKAVKLLEKNQLNYESNILYVSTNESLPSFSDVSDVLNILSIKKGELPQAYKENAKVNLMLLDEGTDIAEVFNDLHCFFRHCQPQTIFMLRCLMR